jgi:hypothetical protein
MDRDNSKGFEKMLKQGLRPQRDVFSEDQRNSHKNQKADNAQLIGIAKALRSDIKNRLTKNPGLQVNFDPTILNGDLSTMSAEALQSMCTMLAATDCAVQEAEAGHSSTVSDFLDKCKDILFGKKCCHKENANIVKPLKVMFDPPPPGFVITPNVKKKLQPSVQV